MFNRLKKYAAFFVIAMTFLSSCSSGSSSGVFSAPLLLTVDSTNDRLFVIENDGILYALTASTRSGLGKQPAVNRKRATDIHDLLPTAPTNISVADISGVSRLFITGARSGSSLNEILVLDFDGSTFTQADISPLTIDDGDVGTDNSADVLGGLLVDSADGILYVTNSTSATLSGFNVSDGTEAFSPIALSGSPNKMSLTDGYLYIANASTSSLTQNIFVFKTSDTSLTEIDVGAPTNEISAVTNTNGTVLVARDAAQARIVVRQVNTASYADSTAVAAGDSSVADGEMNAENSIEAAIGTVSLALGSDDILYGYAPQDDGHIIRFTIQADLSSFVAVTKETSLEIFSDSDILTGDDSVGLTVFMTASGTGDLLFIDVGTEKFNAVL